MLCLNNNTLMWKTFSCMIKDSSVRFIYCIPTSFSVNLCHILSKLILPFVWKFYRKLGKAKYIKRENKLIYVNIASNWTSKRKINP